MRNLIKFWNFEGALHGRGRERDEEASTAQHFCSSGVRSTCDASGMIGVAPHYTKQKSAHDPSDKNWSRDRCRWSMNWKGCCCSAALPLILLQYDPLHQILVRKVLFGKITVKISAHHNLICRFLFSPRKKRKEKEKRFLFSFKEPRRSLDLVGLLKRPEGRGLRKEVYLWDN